MSKKISTSILGATGYTGLELIRLLLVHPQVELKYLVSPSHAGQKLSAVYPHLQGICDLKLTATPPEEVAQNSDLVFLALPHLEAQKIVPKIIGKTKIIDLSGDFRLKDPAMFQKYYAHNHEYTDGLKDFVYGLADSHEQAATIKQAHNIANPGCFAITSELALSPLKDHIKHVDIFAITGSSGAGKAPADTTHHPIRAHNVKSYKICEHQHIPEIIQAVNLTENQLNFVPTSGPFVRGIHLTAFVETDFDDSQNLPGQIEKSYIKFYENSPFIRIKNQVALSEVIGSNFCDIAITAHNGKLIIQAAIDNLVKGAAGTAIQNMNLLFDLPQTTGLLNLSPLFP